MFSMPARKTITEKPLQYDIRNKIPPACGDNFGAFQLSFLPAKFESLANETFVLIVAVQNDNRTKSRRNIAGDDVLQIFRQNAAANIYRAGKAGATPALWQRTSTVRDRRRHNHIEPLDQH